MSQCICYRKGRRKIDRPLLLLPFVHGIDSAACSQAFAFAQETNADLLLVALLPPAREGQRQKIRPEAIAQAYDFFELMRNKAERYGVKVTCTHLLTPNITQSIYLLTQEMLCTGVLLFVREGHGVLLETEEIKHLLTQQISIYIIRLESHRSRVTQGLTALTTWFGELFKEPFLSSSHTFREAHEKGKGKG